MALSSVTIQRIQTALADNGCGTELANAVNYGLEASTITNTAITTNGAGTLTGAAIVGGLITRTGSTSAFTDTTDTAANIITALGTTAAVGETWMLQINNQTAFAQTLSAGTSVTLSGLATPIPGNATGEFLCTYATATTVTMRCTEIVYNAVGGADPNNVQTVFGGSAAGAVGGVFFEEGNIYRNVGNPIAANAADTTDDIIGGFQLPASCLDVAGRGICITAQGKSGATGNNKKMRLWINPTMSGQAVNADGSISGGTVTGAGTGVMLIDTGVTTINAKGWCLTGNLFKYGAAASNTQYFQGSTILDTTHGGIGAVQLLTQTESAVINLVVTGSSSTTGAASDVILNFIELNGMN